MGVPRNEAEGVEENHQRFSAIQIDGNCVMRPMTLRRSPTRGDSGGGPSPPGVATAGALGDGVSARSAALGDGVDPGGPQKGAKVNRVTDGKRGHVWGAAVVFRTSVAYVVVGQ